MFGYTLIKKKELNNLICEADRIKEKQDFCISYTNLKKITTDRNLIAKILVAFGYKYFKGPYRMAHYNVLYDLPSNGILQSVYRELCWGRPKDEPGKGPKQ